jgi:hypothetical protein
MPCIACGRGFHEECYTECEICHPINELEESIRTVGRGSVKDPKNIKDVHSTGRKRAAVYYPIFEGEPCEWKGKKNCGGGVEPIIGCIDGKQVHRHHGPIKNPLHNEPGNVHRICPSCHNRWHKENDDIYDEKVYATLPHSPELANEMELLANEAYYRMRR